MSRRRRRRASAAAAEPPESEGMSAAEKMAAFKEEMHIRHTQRAVWTDTLGFTPDAFQIDAMDAVERGESVLVAAPTGAGKTVVGEFATHLALSRSRRSFYTTPIKALSNQKFVDLRRRFGEDKVGLLTGDVSINPHAPVVVMTTEVLRNMIYAGADLSDLESVVLDEVHYLADRFRGPVWEEVIIHLPAGKQIVALSATVSNAEEFGQWVSEVRSGCRVIVSETRPVPLYQHMMVGSTLYDLYAPSKDGRGVSGRINPELLDAVSPGARTRNGRGSRNWNLPEAPRRRESRASTLITLDRAGLLPAITFIFSRAGCQDAVDQILATRIVLTTRDEAEEIRRYVDEVSRMIAPEDYAVLGVSQWASALERGVAAHHAGMLPIMKEAVEHLFTRGLIKMVYATETLALGINMPARCVVIESLRKWNGAEHVRLTPGEFTQLSGRAGRRGIDTEGHAVVLHRGSVAPEEVAALASKRTYPLVSAFTPRYNMVVNLLDHSTRAATRSVLETSFAQFQADQAVVHLATRSRELTARLSHLSEAMSCSRGDASEYFALRDEIAQRQKTRAKLRADMQRQANRESVVDLLPGDVVSYGKGRRILFGVVAFQERSATGRIVTTLIGTDAKWHTLPSDEGRTGITKVGRIPIAGGSALRRNKERVRIGDELRRLVRSGALRPASSRLVYEDEDIDELERRLRRHPVHQCPRREEHAGAGHQWARLNREHAQVMKSIETRTNSVAKEFDRVCAVLEQLGFLRGDDVTHRGQQLRRVFGERDLIVIEAISSGAWDGLAAPELAAIASTCVYESRRDEDGQALPPAGMSPSLVRAWDATLEAAIRVTGAEKRAGVAQSALPDPGLMGPCLAWAHGAALSTALSEDEMQGGDFVRWIRQVMDLLDQLRHVDHRDCEKTAREAKNALAHGVVAWSAL